MILVPRPAPSGRRKVSRAAHVTLAEMPLEESLVGWLRRTLCPTADDAELDRCYAFAHPLNADRDIACNGVDPDDATQTLNWHVRFYDEAHGCLHHDNSWASRAALPAMVRWGAGGVGPVALNHFFKLKVEFQKHGFATALYAAEEALYRRWGIVEIQIHALWAGRVVWPRMGFLPKEPELMLIALRVWQEQEGWHGPLPSEFKNYPAEFLLNLDYILLYKVL